MDTGTVIALIVSVLGGLIALYAAVLSRRALEWQKQKDEEQRATKVRIEFEHASSPQPYPLVGMHDDPDPRPYPLYYSLTLQVINDGPASEWVSGIYVEQPPAESAGYDLTPSEDIEVKPRERFKVEFDTADVGFDMSGGFVGVARLASGKRVCSEVEHLEAHLIEHVAEFNKTARV